MIDLKDVKIGMEVVLTADLDDPWTQLRAGNRGKILRVEPEDRFRLKSMLHCAWDNGAVLGCFVDDPIELIPEEAS